MSVPRGTLCSYSCTYNPHTKRRMAGEQNIVWNTEVYVQAAYRQQRKGLRGLRTGEMGLDRV
jgi:hypothetical protein